MIHTLDPYPWSVPISRWRKTDAGPNTAFYPNNASGPRTATPVATTVVSTAASAASAASARCLRCLRAAAVLLLLLLPLLVIFLPGAAAPAGPAPAAGADWIPPCASGSWTNATSWLAASNTASALLVLL